MEVYQNKKITVIIQARTGSKRFPKKVLANIESRPMVWHVINRIKRTKNVEQIILITTRKNEDKILLKIAKENSILGFSGDACDVLNRHYQCALKHCADPIIRITADCPLIDPVIIEEMLQFYLNHDYDYVSNVITPTYPDGLDVEIFSFKTLKNAAQNAKMKSERKHVTPYIKKNINKFKIFNYKNNQDLSGFRWTVDKKEDLEFVKKIYAKMRPKLIFSMCDVLRIISKNPDFLKINNYIR